MIRAIAERVAGGIVGGCLMFVVYTVTQVVS